MFYCRGAQCAAWQQRRMKGSGSQPQFSEGG